MAYYNGNGQANGYNGGAGHDTIYGNNGNDTLNGGDGNDYIDGGNDNDSLLGGLGNDTLLGGAGSDILDGGAGNDLVDGGTGVDTVTYASAVNGMWIELNQGTTAGFSRDGNLSGLMGTDSLMNLENVIGSAHSDIIKGNAAANSLRGEGGNDSLFASMGIDRLDGGTGQDSANFSQTGAVSASLAAGAYTLGTAHYGTLIAIEDLVGSAGNDSLTGNSGNNVLDGGAGGDILTGGVGHDGMWGGAGSDRLVADGGNDTLYGNYSFNGYGDNASDIFDIRTTAGAVTISDFKLGIDKLDLTDFGFNSGGDWTGSAAQSGPDTVLTLTRNSQTVTVKLQGITDGHHLTSGDMINSSAALIAPPPNPAFINGGNGLADIFLIDPQLGNQVISHFENGLDKMDIHFTTTGYWHGGLANVPGSTDTQLVFHGSQGEVFTVTLPGLPYYNIDASDYVL